MNVASNIKPSFEKIKPDYTILLLLLHLLGFVINYFLFINEALSEKSFFCVYLLVGILLGSVIILESVNYDLDPFSNVLRFLSCLVVPFVSCPLYFFQREKYKLKEYALLAAFIYAAFTIGTLELFRLGYAKSADQIAVSYYSQIILSIIGLVLIPVPIVISFIKNSLYKIYVFFLVGLAIAIVIFTPTIMERYGEVGFLIYLLSGFAYWYSIYLAQK
jgi:hypothetical protein